MIAERGAEEWGLDTFLLSCRVLGRGVEHRILSDLGQMAAAAGASRVRLRIEKTKRNTPARSFLESVVPAELRHGGEERIDADVPAGVLAAVTFEPGTASEAPVAEDDGGGNKDGHGAEAAGRLRQRERQIARIAFDLATGAAMKAAVEGRPSPAAASAASATGDIAGVVHAAFASALAVQVDRVVEVDRLEDLGCDSLRVVEITVALSEKFPWLPSTLLFEHRRSARLSRRSRGWRRAVARCRRPRSWRRPPRTPAPSGDDRHRRRWIARAMCRSELARRALEIAEQRYERRDAVPTDRRHFLHPLEDTRPHWAGLLDDPARFDAALFGVSPREAEFMDPQLRLFLEVAWNALEDAGLAGADRETDTGVFAGVMYGDYGALANQSAPGANNPYRCWEGFSLANRLSQLLGFSGPSLAVDTACSSSGTALHLACRALAAGDCRVAVVGGVNLILDPDRFGSLARLGILSTRGQCEPFGADADGTVLGEGAGVVVLRPLDEALRRGIASTASSKAPGSAPATAPWASPPPNPQAQSEAIRRSLRGARIDPRTVTYVETHGTGTALGDPIEVRGLTLGYAAPDLQDSSLDLTHRCRIGSIKPNIGHLEAGAGIVGLIKVLLQMRHGMLVPSITSAPATRRFRSARSPSTCSASWRPGSGSRSASTVRRTSCRGGRR
jgi:3-oxoacyl-(acyl-carrier-protein) synthase